MQAIAWIETIIAAVPNLSILSLVKYIDIQIKINFNCILTSSQ